MGTEPLGPIQWTAPDPPEFLWADKASLKATGKTPEIGKAWYTHYDGIIPDLPATKQDAIQILKKHHQHFENAYKIYGLRERVFAAREGHTAVTFLQLAQLIGDDGLIAQAKKDERLVVVRGKQDVNPETARGILIDAGLMKTTMMLSELDNLATGRIRFDDKDDPVIVRYKAETREEARELLKRLTILTDATKPDYPMTLHAGFSNEELLQGKPGGHNERA